MKGDKNMIEIKKLKKGELFMKKEVPSDYEPTMSQVWVRGDYDRSEKRYECYRYGDVNDFCYLKGSKLVCNDFVF